MENKSSQNANRGVNIIGKGTTIEGALHSSVDLRLDGTIIGDVHMNAKLIMGQSAQINGSLHSKQSGIKGVVKGELHISETLHLHKTAKIEGEIHTKNLIVENGAVLNGNCQVGGQAK